MIGTGHAPTVEQADAIEAFATGEPLAIQAGAGTGKTTTLAMMARTTPRVGQYVAFNKAIAADAGRAMPNTVDCRTLHSIAFQATRRSPSAPLLDRLGGARTRSSTVARHLGLGHLVVTVATSGATRSKVLQPQWQAGHVMRAVQAFCQSGDPEPTTAHFPWVPGIDQPGANANNRAVAGELLPALRKAWADLASPAGKLRYTHDTYLKQWQLAGGRLPGDYVLFDEAQDANPVMLALLAAADQQVVYVGDSQQAIYEWRGAVDAMAGLGNTTFLTQSWRFGPALAGVANDLLLMLDAPLRLTGNPSLDTQVYLFRPAPARPDAVLCRTNGAAVSVVLSYQARGLAPHLVGGNEDIVRFAHAAGQLQAGERTAHPELACFESWREVQAYVADDPQGSELAMLVKLLDEYGTQIVIDALDGLVAEDGADVVVSTAHRAKGREWPSVRLAADWELQEGDALPPDPELRLMYVAATRAQLGLDASACLPLIKLMGYG